VLIAEQANGPIPRRNGPSYVWGVALDQLARMRPDARIINLETAVTRSKDRVHKGINYRMSPENAACRAAVKIDCCALANNHVLDWGRSGLEETVATLEMLNIKATGAGRNDREASAPAVLNIADARLLIFSFGSTSSGIPLEWAATGRAPGVNLLPDLSEPSASKVADQVMALKRPGDLIVVSIHWGSNWGYHIPDEQVAFARTLIDQANVSVVHGHSSHHPRAIEIYRDRLILYGCGDFLNDYERIRGCERYRNDLVLMYFADLDATGDCHAISFALRRASPISARFLYERARAQIWRCETALSIEISLKPRLECIRKSDTSLSTQAGAAPRGNLMCRRSAPLTSPSQNEGRASAVTLATSTPRSSILRT
jgi:poly-gamma-glutamate capsule biosynthesis protein CapA/YwtB (metallophosphatase superfamily)